MAAFGGLPSDELVADPVEYESRMPFGTSGTSMGDVRTADGMSSSVAATVSRSSSASAPESSGSSTGSCRCGDDGCSWWSSEDATSCAACSRKRTPDPVPDPERETVGRAACCVCALADARGVCRPLEPCPPDPTEMLRAGTYDGRVSPLGPTSSAPSFGAPFSSIAPNCTSPRSSSDAQLISSSSRPVSTSSSHTAPMSSHVRPSAFGSFLTRPASSGGAGIVQSDFQSIPDRNGCDRKACMSLELPDGPAPNR